MSDAAPLTRRDKAVSGLKRFGVIFLYFWGLLAISALHKSLVLAESGLSYRQSFAVVNALVLAKILFVAEELKVGERYEREPLIYAMAFKAAVYAVLLAACEILEGLVVGHFRGKTLAESLSEVGGGTPFGILTTTVLLFFALLPFFGFRELCAVVGEPELHRCRLRVRLCENSWSPSQRRRISQTNCAAGTFGADPAQIPLKIGKMIRDQVVVSRSHAASIDLSSRADGSEGLPTSRFGKFS